MMGAPKEHLVEKLKGYVLFLKSAQNSKMISSSIAVPRKNEKDKKLFTTYAELEIMFKDASALAFFCFDYMPSSIEILQPTELSYRATDFAAFFNDMLERIYRLDLLLKNLKATNAVLEKNAGLLLRNNIILSLKNKDKTISELSKNTGIPEDQLEKFINNRLLSDGWLLKKGDIFSINHKKVKVNKD